MNRLHDFLTNHKDSDFNDLPDKSIRDLTGLTEYNTVKELLNDFDIYTTMQVIKFNTDILRLVEYDKEFAKYKWLTQYVLFGSIIFALVYPIIVSNNWLYFGVLLLPFGIFSGGLIKTQLYNLSWIVAFVLMLIANLTKHYEIIRIAIPHLALMLGLRNGKLLFRETMIRSAKRNELCFKFLYYIQMIQLYDRTNDKFIKI